MAVKSKVKSRDGPHLKWSNDDMMAAMEAVPSDKVNVTAASREFNVPRKTLDDRVKGRVTHTKKPGVRLSSRLRKRESLANTSSIWWSVVFHSQEQWSRTLAGQYQNAQVETTGLILTVVSLVAIVQEVSSYSCTS